MTAVLTGTMVVWGAHTLLWYRRTLLERGRREVAAGGAARPGRRSRRTRRRARRRSTRPCGAAARSCGASTCLFRVVHALIVATFFVLVVTGLPLRFRCTAWAPGLMRILGRRDAGRGRAPHRRSVRLRLLRAVRRLRDLARLGTAGAGARLVRPATRSSSGPQDLRDAVAMVKWFFGRGPQPRFGRYSYMEKFDYFAELWGVGAIGFTGLMLWQPEFFGAVLPGRPVQRRHHRALVRGDDRDGVHLHDPLLQRAPPARQVAGGRGDVHRPGHAPLHGGGAPAGGRAKLRATCAERAPSAQAVVDAARAAAPALDERRGRRRAGSCCWGRAWC